MPQLAKFPYWTAFLPVIRELSGVWLIDVGGKIKLIGQLVVSHIKSIGLFVRN